MLSCWLFETLWAIVHQASMSTDSPGKNTGVGCHFLLQGILPTQGLNPGLPHCRQILYLLSHQGNPYLSIANTQISMSSSTLPWNSCLYIPPQSWSLPLGLQTNISDLTRSDLDSSPSTVPACIVGSISWTRSSLYGAGQVKAKCWSSHFLMRSVGKSHWLCFQCVFGNSNPYYLVQITVILAWITPRAPWPGLAWRAAIVIW